MRTPRQRRSRRTADRLADVAVQLMKKRPFEAISVDEIVAKARTSKGAFYYRFENKNALLEHLNGRLFETALERWSGFLDPERWRARALSEFIDAFAARLVEIYTARAPLMRAVLREARRGEPHAAARMRELNVHVLRGFITIIEEHAAEVAHPAPRRAAGVALTMLATLLPVLLLFPDDAARMASLDADATRVEITRLLRSYLMIGDD